MKYQHQIDQTDCGPACIAMVASHYKLYISRGKIRELCKTDFIGTNLAGIGASGRIIVDRDTVFRMILRKLDFMNENYEQRFLRRSTET